MGFRFGFGLRLMLWPISLKLNIEYSFRLSIKLGEVFSNVHDGQLFS